MINWRESMKHLCLSFFCVLICHIQAQEPGKATFQIIQGEIRDYRSHLPIDHVVVMADSSPENGAITDKEGKFTLKCPVGRLTLSISHPGYQQRNIILFLKPSKQEYLEIYLVPSVRSLEEVTIEATIDKSLTNNQLVYGSGRSFNTEEAFRYAGSLGDPARMVRAYAGVVPSNDTRNDIVIRGNSPSGLLWRIDDIEIPNPNHFANVGLTGSTVTLLNPNMMKNSDFLSGAFPAEYGNALSGVFDVKLKKGNADDHEFRFGTGWNGFELAAEGPFSKKRKIGSFITSYRYSFLDVLDKLGINVPILPKYQDLTSKLDFVVTEKLHLSVLGLLGESKITLDERDNSKNTKPRITRTGSDIALGGLTLTYRPNYKTSYKVNVTGSTNGSATTIDTLNIKSNSSGKILDDNARERRISFLAKAENYALKNNFFTLGFRFDDYRVDFNQSLIIDRKTGLEQVLNQSGRRLRLLRLFMQDEYNFTKKMSVTAGLHYQWLDLNGSRAIEPRLGIRYYLTDKHRLGVAYGNHHQKQVSSLYFYERNFPRGAMSNKNLDFSQANHFTISYEWKLNPFWRILTDAYYQSLRDIPVSSAKNSNYSALNAGSGFYFPQKENLVNQGRGRNLGWEFTLEKFFSNDYYLLFNSSIFRSEYATPNTDWTSTIFDLGFTANLAMGYEYPVSPYFFLGFDSRSTLAGGRPFTPTDEAASIIAGKEILRNNAPFSARENNYFRTDLRLYYKTNGKKTYVKFAIDFQNLTNHKNVFSRRYDPEEKKYIFTYQQQFFPMYTFEILF